ncbi:lipopolysaccharide/colanic/teichoic acid biosynthesis glycosyltransferase [Yoonia maritima]|uniref:Lipopolysaccharide/colanic/teichoic acid biosynthesis glycosyltransferase n=1 Tax=Yoonia maritima TaxID=1435347 RepID=A0A2T0VZS4_9RHOB|nr:sugar transferase [Yoonia maritima]PRY78056.1 lipopolysaccharide/colanic/teichoic acid biosynthesis glycosyltransferase [Yoonia maritima]
MKSFRTADFNDDIQTIDTSNSGTHSSFGDKIANLAMEPILALRASLNAFGFRRYNRATTSTTNRHGIGNDVAGHLVLSSALNGEDSLATTHTNIKTSFLADLVGKDAGQTDRQYRLYTKHLKRVFDVLICLMLLPIVTPIILGAWTLVKREGGPGFFSQDRVGRDGRIFRCLKLRTMRVDAEERLKQLCASDPKVAHEWHTYQKLANDPRISKLGGFLRETSIDELPQVFNVLRGDMSIVGPRPFMPSQDELYKNAGGSHYYSLRPGVTGLWQVEGRGNTKFIDRVRYDNEYANKLSFVSDVCLILKTAKVVVCKTGC